MKNNLFLIVLLNVLGNTAFAKNKTDTISLMRGRDSLDFVGEKIYYLEDAEGQLSIENILSAKYQSAFKKNDKPIFVRSVTNKTYWLKMIIENQSDEDLYIEIKNQSIWYLDYYVIENDMVQHTVELGSQRPAKYAPYPSNFYWLKLKKSKTTQIVYLRIQTQAAFIIPVSVGYLPQLIVRKSYYDFIFYSFIGIIVATIVYSLSLFITIRDVIYLIYTIYLLLVLLQIPTFNGYPIIINALGNEVRFYLFKYFLFWNSLLYLFVFLFEVYFLDLKNKLPKAFYINLIFIIFICVVVPVVNLFSLTPYYIVGIVHLLLILSFYFLVLGIGLYQWLFHKSRNALFYSIAWIWVVLGNFIIVLVFNGFLPYNFYTSSAQFVGFILEIIFFFVALGDRYNTLRRQREMALHENIRIIVDQKNILEQEVSERTRELRTQLANFALRLAEESDYYQEVQKLIGENKNNNDQILRKLKDRKDPKTEWDDFKRMFDQLHPAFYNKLLTMASSITPQEMKLASLLKINLNSKEIASILNINEESVFKARYRLRKKLKIESEDNLVIFLINLA